MGSIFSPPKPKLPPAPKIPTKEESAKELDDSHQKLKKGRRGEQGRAQTILSKGVQGDDTAGGGLATKKLLGGK